MISFIQLPYRQSGSGRQPGTKSILVGFTVGLLVSAQVGLLLWAMIR